jgi:uncharacterized cupredoxin-like copper-binding protein
MPMPKVTIAVAIIAFFAAMALVTMQAPAHEQHGSFSAGEPGDPKKPARTVKVAMVEKDNKLLFEPALIEVCRGEQIRFVVSNDGIFNHEFVLATVAENRRHDAMMKKHPDMQHEDPNMLSVTSYLSGDMVWKFTKKGEFEFACLIGDHYERGMHGKIIVK